MKPGSRTLGVAFSDGAERSWLAGVLIRTNRAVDALTVGTCTVGGLDATDALIDLFVELDREDAQRVLCAGIAPAWFNLLDLHRIHEAIDRPVLAVSYEESAGLESTLHREFEGDALEARLAIYRRQPPRYPIDSVEEDLFVRSVGVEDSEARRIVASLPRENSRPEPTRVAKLAASAFRRACVETDCT